LHRLRQIGLRPEPAAFREPEVLAELQLTIEQRDRIRAIEEEPWFRWVASTRYAGPPDPPRPKERPASERVLEVLTDEQARRWKRMIGPPFKGPGPFPPFGPPPSPQTSSR
jgi:hypothetical protein